MKRLALSLLLLGATAHADTADTLLVSGYVLSLGLSSISTAVNGTALAYDQPSSRGWRILGMASGATDIGVGTALFITSSDKASGVVLGTIAVAVGAAAFTTGYFAREDVQLGVMKVAKGGILTVGGRF